MSAEVEQLFAVPTVAHVVSADHDAGVYELSFPYRVAPITENGRYHHMQKAALVRSVVETTWWLAREARIPALGRCAVELTWLVNTRVRRDVENIVPTFKAMCDGLVRYGVVADDTPDLMTKVMPVIDFAPKHDRPHARMVLRVARLTD